jgi:hypothetical protein
MCSGTLLLLTALARASVNIWQSSCIVFKAKHTCCQAGVVSGICTTSTYAIGTGDPLTSSP